MQLFHLLIGVTDGKSGKERVPLYLGDSFDDAEKAYEADLAKPDGCKAYYFFRKPLPFKYRARLAETAQPAKGKASKAAK